MNLLIKLASVLMVSTALISCEDGAHNHNTTHTATQVDNQAGDQSDNMEHDAKISIELNNGEKWLVNDEMKPSVAKGEQALNEYLNSKSEDYKSLAQELKSADESLISSCTMDGPSHDELHKWLHPHLTLVSELENAKSVKEANEVIEKLNVSFKNYHTYFQ